MRRADRLFQIIQLLRRRRTVTTAAQIAEKLEVSERTVYRDIRDLTLAGTPIEGAAGVGYRIRPGYDLPPLMFDREEIQALVLGARIVRQFGDPALARGATPSWPRSHRCCRRSSSRCSPGRNCSCRRFSAATDRPTASPSRAKRWSRAGG
jgi:predicted DNA-binding transcriptional regulator YafY